MRDTRDKGSVRGKGKEEGEKGRRAAGRALGSDDWIRRGRSRHPLNPSGISRGEKERGRVFRTLASRSNSLDHFRFSHPCKTIPASFIKFSTIFRAHSFLALCASASTAAFASASLVPLTFAASIAALMAASV